MKVFTKRPWEMPANILDADLIFVLAGLEVRKAYALQLYRAPQARSIMLSVGRFEIRKLSSLEIPTPIDLLGIAAHVPASQRHYFVWFEAGDVHAERVLLRRFGTWSEIIALARFLHRRPDIASLVVVSSSYHLSRIRLCCRALLPARLRIRLLASPENVPSRTFLSEWFKILVYRVLSWFPSLNERRKQVV
jgi:hypothetical protein